MSTRERKLRFMAETGRYRPLREAAMKKLGMMDERELADFLTDEQFEEIVSEFVRDLRRQDRHARAYREHQTSRRRGIVVTGLAWGRPPALMEDDGPGAA